MGSNMNKIKIWFSGLISDLNAAFSYLLTNFGPVAIAAAAFMSESMEFEPLSNLILFFVWLYTVLLFVMVLVGAFALFDDKHGDAFTDNIKKHTGHTGLQVFSTLVLACALAIVGAVITAVCFYSVVLMAAALVQLCEDLT